MESYFPANPVGFSATPSHADAAMEPVQQEQAQLTWWISSLLWGWGIVLAAGAYWRSQTWHRPAVILFCVGAFWAFWKLVQRHGAARTARRAETPTVSRSPDDSAK